MEIIIIYVKHNLILVNIMSLFKDYNFIYCLIGHKFAIQV